MTQTAINTGVATYLAEATPTQRFGAATALIGGNFRVAGNDRSNRMLFKIDLSSIGSGQYITDARFQLFDAGDGAGAVPSPLLYTAYRVTVATTDPLLANWATSDGTTPWSSFGGDFSLADTATATLASVTGNLDFTGMGTADLCNDAYANRNRMLYLLVNGPEDTGADQYNSFASYNHATEALRPTLTLTHETSVHYQCALAVQSTIRSMDLDSLADANVLVQKLPVYRGDGLPVVTLSTHMPETMRPGAGTNIRDDVGYPVHVSLVAEGKQNLTNNHARNLLWRQRILRAFRHQRLAGVDGVWTCLVEPGPTVDASWFPAGRDVSSFVLRFINREVRGL